MKQTKTNGSTSSEFKWNVRHGQEHEWIDVYHKPTSILYCRSK